MNKINNKKIIPLLLVLCLFMIVRLLPVLKSPLNTYGYDYGFYLYAAKTATVGFQSLVGILGGYNHPLLSVLQLFHVDPAAGLNALMFLAAVLVGAAFYFVFEKKMLAIWTAVLAALSVPQSEAYLLFLFKNELGLILLLLALGCIMRKRWKWSVGVSVLLLLSHRTTFVMYALTVGAYVLYVQLLKKQWKYIIGELLAGVAVVFATYSWWGPRLHDFLINPNRAVHEGIFLYGHNFLALTWPYILLAIPGVYYYVKRKEHPLLLLFTAIAVLWSVFHLPFYNRVLLYVDVGLIVYAAYFLALAPFTTKARQVVAGVFLLAAVVTASVFNLGYRPLISQTDLQEVQQLRFPPGSFVVALSAEDAPWLLGNLPLGVRLAAPGLFEDRHTYEAWVGFWNNETDETFFAPYPRPLYVYSRSWNTLPQLAPCLRPQSKNFSQVVCP